MKYQNILAILILPLIYSCISSYYLYEGNSQIYDNASYEIRIAYKSLEKEYLRIYFVPKNEYTCDANIIDLKATLIIKSRDSLLNISFNSKSDSSIYYSYYMDTQLESKDKNNVFRTYYMSGPWPDVWQVKSRSKYAYCMANLYSLDTNRITINKNDTIKYEIYGTIQVHNSQIIEIDKKGIMKEGKFNGKYNN